MFEVPDAGENHRHVFLITKVDRVLILNGTTWLNHRPYALLARYFNAIGKWEERVGRHYRLIEFESK
jgi:hypothetical protein